MKKEVRTRVIHASLALSWAGSCYVDPDTVRRTVDGDGEPGGKPSRAGSGAVMTTVGGGDGGLGAAARNTGGAGSEDRGAGAGSSDGESGSGPAGGGGATGGGHGAVNGGCETATSGGARAAESGRTGEGGDVSGGATAGGGASGRSAGTGGIEVAQGGDAGTGVADGGMSSAADGGQAGTPETAEPCASIEGCRCLPGRSPSIACGSSNEGSCRLGEHVCLETTGRYGPCVGAVSKTREVCDGTDNDCDGYADFEKDPVSGLPVSICACEYSSYAISESGPDNRYPSNRQYFCANQDTTCTIDSEGDLSMKTCLHCSGGLAWSTCRFSLGQDFSRFDASAGNSGLIEVLYCLDAPVAAEVALWYGVASPEYRRKKLVVARAGDPPGCRSAYFTPSEACFNELPGLPASCVDRCGNDLPPECVFDYRSATLLLTVSGCSADVNSTVRILSVTYLSDTCRCFDDASCKSGDRTSCSSVTGDLSLCVSSDCEGSGEPCATVVGGKECRATLRCLDGWAVCPTTGCE